MLGENRKLTNRLTNIMIQIDKLRNRHGKEVAADFRKLPIRTGTDYYKFITKPISLHTILRTVKKGGYVSAQKFIDDLAQVTWNARHYNEPNSLIYENALILDQFIRDVALVKLKNDKVVPNHHLLYYPDLGPLEDYGVSLESIAAAGGAVSQSPPPMSAPTPAAVTPTAAATPFTFKQELLPLHDPDALYQDDYKAASPPNYGHREISHPPSARHNESGVKRGRPPIIDKPYESRIKLILKAFKKFRHPQDDNYLLSSPFEKLPDKSLDSYYQLIKSPISLNEIRIKVRSRKYANVDQFLADLNLMLNNAKEYYTRMQDHELFRDVGYFEAQAQAAIQQELSKPDSELIEPSADGLRYPLDVIEVRGYKYRIGDWVLIRNPNDASKPTAGQIFRLWKTEDGTLYTNVCWYIRPEQTCHRVDRLFFKNEVCKTGEYRDHLAEDIERPCYVIFLTHYQKGDIPQELSPPGSPWFICEFRYNGTTHVFNRIRTWKACLPDEIRGQDQPIVPINEPRKLVKFVSPIKHVLPPDAYPGMPIPPPTLGPSPHGPPAVGLVYLSDPFPNDELGQTTSSIHVTPVPEYDDPKTGRKAYLFTPISQLKGGGGGATTTTAVLPGTLTPRPRFDDNGQLTHFEEYNYTPPVAAMSPPYASTFTQPAASPTVQPTVQNSLIHQQQQQQQQHHHQQQQQQQQNFQFTKSYNAPDIGAPFVRKNYSPTIEQPAQSFNNHHYHTSKSTYSNTLNGGVLAYALEDELSSLSENLITQANGEGKSMIWFRTPPVGVASQEITDSPVGLGHTSTYLAWKLQQNQGEYKKVKY